MLTAAAVQGPEFDSLIVADACGSSPIDSDNRLRQLARIHGLLRMVRAHELPNGELCIRYAFVHILYQQTIYHDLLPTRRASLSLALARAIENRYGKDNPTVAAQLACLFEVGRDRLQSSHQLWLASVNAGRVFAHGEAIVLARRGIDLLQTLPRSPQTAALELKLQTTLGLQLQVMHGYAEPSARLAYQRVRRLCREVPTGPLFPVLWGLWLFHKVRSELSIAQRLAEELIGLAHDANDPDLALQAHQALAMTVFCRGCPSVALGHVEQAAALYDPRSHTSHADEFGQDPGVICKAFGAVVLWLLGYPDAAVRQSEAAIAMSQNLSPSSQAIALHFASMVHQLRRDPAQTKAHAERCAAIAEENGFALWMAGSAIFRGWALAANGQPDEGINAMRKALVDWEATGAVTYRTYYLGSLAESMLATDALSEAQTTLEDALALADRSGEGLFRSELYRLRGETVLREPPDDGTISRAAMEFQRALTIAATQEAKSLQLRAATSLVRLNDARELEPDESRQLLSCVYDSFSEGLLTPDLREAKQLLSLSAI